MYARCGVPYITYRGCAIPSPSRLRPRIASAVARNAGLHRSRGGDDNTITMSTQADSFCGSLRAPMTRAFDLRISNDTSEKTFSYSAAGPFTTFVGLLFSRRPRVSTLLGRTRFSRILQIKRSDSFPTIRFWRVFMIHSLLTCIYDENKTKSVCINFKKDLTFSWDDKFKDVTRSENCYNFLNIS